MGTVIKLWHKIKLAHNAGLFVLKESGQNVTGHTGQTGAYFGSLFTWSQNWKRKQAGVTQAKKQFYNTFLQLNLMNTSNNMHHLNETSALGSRRSLLLLAVLVLLAVGCEALGLQKLGSSSSLAEGTLVLFQESLLFLQSCFLICMEALQLLKATLKLKHKQRREQSLTDASLFL